MLTKISFSVSWGETDAYQHVNNVVFLQWFENARIEWLDEVKFPEREGVMVPILKKKTIVYESLVEFPAEVTVSVKAIKIGNASVTLAYEVRSRSLVVHRRRSKPRSVLAATGETVLILTDISKPRRAKPTKIPPKARAAIVRHDPGVEDTSQTGQASPQ